MKKFSKTVLFFCALSSLVYATEISPVVAETNTQMSTEEQKEAMDILDRMREKIEKEEAEKAVAREEAEVAGYYEIMGEEKARPSIMDEQKTEVTEKTIPTEVQQDITSEETQQ